MKLSRISLVVVFLVFFTCISWTNKGSDTNSNNNNSNKADTVNYLQKNKKGGGFTFFIVSDWGWNGFKLQQEVADEMGVIGDKIDPRFIVSCGDNFQLQGVASAQDPLWQVNFENVYKNLSLHVDWYPVLGNHDYKGSTQAEIDYSKISRRWRLESHYYTFARKVNDSISARFIFLDTPPFVEEYHHGNGYPDVASQDTAKQIQWLAETLANSKEQWKLVFGHHPIY
jgi:predicted MPP superfamily phosphohydrolase